MIGEALVSLILAGVFFTWLSFVQGVWTDPVLEPPSKIFLSALLTVLGAIAFLFVYFFVPTSAVNQVVPPEEYDYVKNDRAAVYLHENDYRYTEDAYLFDYAGDSSKVKLTQTNWNNIEGETIGTTINVNQK